MTLASADYLATYLNKIKTIDKTKLGKRHINMDHKSILAKFARFPHLLEQVLLDLNTKALLAIDGLSSWLEETQPIVSNIWKIHLRRNSKDSIIWRTLKARMQYTHREIWTGMRRDEADSYYQACQIIQEMIDNHGDNFNVSAFHTQPKREKVIELKGQVSAVEKNEYNIFIGFTSGVVEVRNRWTLGLISRINTGFQPVKNIQLNDWAFLVNFHSGDAKMYDLVTLNLMHSCPKVSRDNRRNIGYCLGPSCLYNSKLSEIDSMTINISVQRIIAQSGARAWTLGPVEAHDNCISMGYPISPTEETYLYVDGKFLLIDVASNGLSQRSVLVVDAESLQRIYQRIWWQEVVSPRRSYSGVIIVTDSEQKLVFWDLKKNKMEEIVLPKGDLHVTADNLVSSDRSTCLPAFYSCCVSGHGSRLTLLDDWQSFTLTPKRPYSSRLNASCKLEKYTNLNLVDLAY